MYYHPNTTHKNFTKDLSKTRLRLHEIARQLKEDDLSIEERDDLIRESKDLILKENVGELRETIEQNIDEGKSETEIWRYCQAKITSLDESINEVLQKLNDRNSNSDLRSQDQNLVTDLNNLRHLKNTVIQLQNYYCPSTQAQTKNNDSRYNSAINWIGTETELINLLKLLKNKRLIINQEETDEIIQNHFEEPGKPTMKPIQWEASSALLAYLIERLEKKYVSHNNIWADISPHFFVAGKQPTNLKQTAYNYREHNKSGKPRGYKRIDTILSRISS